MIKPVTVKGTKHALFLRTPYYLIEKIDGYAVEAGFKSRTKAVLSLITAGLRRHEDLKRVQR